MIAFSHLSIRNAFPSSSRTVLSVKYKLKVLLFGSMGRYESVFDMTACSLSIPGPITVSIKKKIQPINELVCVICTRQDNEMREFTNSSAGFSLPLSQVD